MLIYVQGAWRYLRLKISYEWFRLSFLKSIIMLRNKIHPLFFLGIVSTMSLFSSCSNNDSPEEKEDPMVPQIENKL